MSLWVRPTSNSRDTPRISRGYDEAVDRKKGLFRADLHDPASWPEVILRGPQIGVATPFFKQPPETGTKGRPQDLTTLPDNALPRSEYARATDLETYRDAQDKWVALRKPDHLRRYTEFYRVMWRYMIPDDTDRSLFPRNLSPRADAYSWRTEPGDAVQSGTALTAWLLGCVSTRLPAARLPAID